MNKVVPPPIEGEYQAREQIVPAKPAREPIFGPIENIVAFIGFLIVLGIFTWISRGH